MDTRVKMLAEKIFEQEPYKAKVSIMKNHKITSVLSLTSRATIAKLDWSTFLIQNWINAISFGRAAETWKNGMCLKKSFRYVCEKYDPHARIMT